MAIELSNFDLLDNVSRRSAAVTIDVLHEGLDLAPKLESATRLDALVNEALGRGISPDRILTAIHAGTTYIAEASRKHSAWAFNEYETRIDVTDRDGKTPPPPPV